MPVFQRLQLDFQWNKQDNLKSHYKEDFLFFCAKHSSNINEVIRVILTLFSYKKISHTKSPKSTKAQKTRKSIKSTKRRTKSTKKHKKRKNVKKHKTPIKQLFIGVFYAHKKHKKRKNTKRQTSSFLSLRCFLSA